MPENSFDIVSKIDLQEVSNAIQHALKEVHTRFDLKDSKSNIELEGKDAIVLHSIDEFKLKAVSDILQQKLAKRGVPLAGRSDREGERDRKADQDLQEQGAGLDPGRPGARQRQGPGFATRGHRPAEAA